MTPIDERQEAPATLPLTEKPVFRQFVKFLIVGGSSFIIDYCIRMTLLFAIPYGDGRWSDHIGRILMEGLPVLFGSARSPYYAAFPVAATVAAAFAILNSFVWNRMWTFRIKGKEERMSQLRRFVVISVIGLVMNVIISSLLNQVLPFDEKWSARVATVLAAAIVAIWNFSGQRLYAFKARGK